MAGVAVAGLDVGEAYGNPNANKTLRRILRICHEPEGACPEAVPSGPQPWRFVGYFVGMRSSRTILRTCRHLSCLRLSHLSGISNAAPAYGLSPEDLTLKASELNPNRPNVRTCQTKHPCSSFMETPTPLFPQGNSQTFADTYQRKALLTRFN